MERHTDQRESRTNDERTVFNKRGGDNSISIHERTKLYPSLPPYTKINSDYIVDPNVRAKSIKHLEKNTVVIYTALD